jgi:hypothetical protein
MADDKKSKAGKAGKKNKLAAVGDEQSFDTAELATTPSESTGSRAGLGKKIAVASAAVAAAGAAAAGIVAVKRRRASSASSDFTGPEGETATLPGATGASAGVADEVGAGVETEENATVGV